ncbi:SMI1/KNR4 family protein [Pseudomonas viridiflava]|uniref:SMI1/KNR4 family protein n=1 Tax=Pseudomonas viridiflava TaxID=33069 RepID=UPI000F013BC0|nr:SMI1/KNR4 family protein [Pseudomonas viridiflava]
MLIPLVDSEAKLSNSEIDDFELALNAKLPSSFKDLYCAKNGGYIDDQKGGNSLLLAGFVPIKYGRLPIEQAYKELVDDYPSLVGRIPFAFDEGGNYFLLSIGNQNSGEVGLWIMDTEEYHLVASDFRSFLDRLAS